MDHAFSCGCEYSIGFVRSLWDWFEAVALAMRGALPVGTDSQGGTQFCLISFHARTSLSHSSYSVSCTLMALVARPDRSSCKTAANQRLSEIYSKAIAWTDAKYAVNLVANSLQFNNQKPKSPEDILRWKLSTA